MISGPLSRLREGVRERADLASRNARGQHVMVDRAARDELGRAIRRLVAGLSTNDQYEDTLSAGLRRSRDLGVRSIRLAAWHLYDDLHEHRLEGRYAIGRAGRRRVAHWVLFLKSDLEYEWPNLAGWRAFTLASPTS